MCRRTGRDVEKGKHMEQFPYRKLPKGRSRYLRKVSLMPYYLSLLASVIGKISDGLLV